MGLFKKYAPCIMTFFILSITCHTLSILLDLLSVLFPETTNYGIRKSKIFCIMALSAYHVLSKEVGNRIFKQSRSYTHVFITNPY